MLIYNNSENETRNHVEFIDYTGTYPNLCSGLLTLRIDGKEVTFGNDFSNGKSGQYDSFWSSGGCVYFTNNWVDEHVETGEWRIDVSEIPEPYRKYAAEIDQEFNANVPWGCCGGCI